MKYFQPSLISLVNKEKLFNQICFKFFPKSFHENIKIVQIDLAVEFEIDSENEIKIIDFWIDRIHFSDKVIYFFGKDHTFSYLELNKSPGEAILACVLNTRYLYSDFTIDDIRKECKDYLNRIEPWRI